MAIISGDVFFGTLTELNAKLRAREISCVELTRAFCDRLERVGPRYNALALGLRETALAKARAVDDDLKRERFRGMAQGIPFGVKDLLSIAVKPTTWGAKPYASQRFVNDATVIKKLNSAGAVAAGKLAMVELAGAGGYRYAAASLTGACLNPWDVTKWSGGSSSGPAAAVAAGLVAFAIGSETWGSILTPSAFCGVTGLRPTYGLVSRYGAMALSWTMDKVGPICRSAEDCGHVLQAISGGDANDPSSLGKSFYYTPQFARKIADLRIGYAPVDVAEHAPAALRPAFTEAMGVLREMGAKMIEVELPQLPYADVARIIIASEGSAAFEEMIHSGQVEQLADQKQIAGLMAGLEIPAKDYLRAMRIRSIIREEMRKLFVKVDVLVSPSRFAIAPPVDAPLDQTAGRETPRAHRGLEDLLTAGNLAGLPALSLPCGFAGGLPVALQLVGRLLTENNLLAVGAEFQRRTDWHRRRPPELPQERV